MPEEANNRWVCTWCKADKKNQNSILWAFTRSTATVTFRGHEDGKQHEKVAAARTNQPDIA